MSHTSTLTDEQFQALPREAAQRGETPEALMLELIDQLPTHPVYDNVDDWFRHLGLTEEEIEESRRLAALDDDSDEGVVNEI